MGAKPLFSEQDLEAVRAAVAAAEGETAGEIVPYVVDASDGYEGAAWKAAALGGLAAALVAALAHQLAGLWPGGSWWLLLPPAAGASAGYLLALLVPAARRALVGDEVLERRVRRRAAVAFLEEEVFRTADRTGVLLFLSLFERRVVVLGDSGINAHVGTAEWVSIADRIAAGIRAGRPGEALVEGIAACGRLLEERGVSVAPDDRNELRDELRRRDR